MFVALCCTKPYCIFLSCSGMLWHKTWSERHAKVWFFVHCWILSLPQNKDLLSTTFSLLDDTHSWRKTVKMSVLSTLDLSLNPSIARCCVCLCLLTLMSEGGGGRGGGNRGSRCRDGTLPDGLLHDTPPLHLVHQKFYRDKGREDEGWGGKGGKDKGPRGECGGDGRGRGGGGRKSISEAFYWIDIIAPPSAW